MTKRIDYGKQFPKSIKGLLEVEKYVHQSSLDPKIFELVKMRASQINGCAFCLDMHSKDARAAGETEQRLYLLNAWREAPFYSEKERAALEWTEILTLVHQHHVSDELYQKIKEHFDDEEMMALTMTIIAINGWNRLSIGFGTEAGTYEPQKNK